MDGQTVFYNGAVACQTGKFSTSPYPGKQGARVMFGRTTNEAALVQVRNLKYEKMTAAPTPFPTPSAVGFTHGPSNIMQCVSPQPDCGAEYMEFCGRACASSARLHLCNKNCIYRCLWCQNDHNLAYWPHSSMYKTDYTRQRNYYIISVRAGVWHIPSPGSSSTNFAVRSNGKTLSVVFHPGVTNTASRGAPRLPPHFNNQDMGWVPETDRFHRITIVLRSSFVHTYRIESAGRVWQKDFEDAAWYSDTSTPTVNSITPGGMRKYVQTGGSHRVFLDSISGPVHPKTHFNPKMAEPQTCEG
mmetsp:Transcript_5409/g.9051  ORF Transcript_5409/g.9051 Transcript_5409/m.9051 type:complete len:301 (-) Transcript_5409:117-1019(-)